MIPLGIKVDFTDTDFFLFEGLVGAEVLAEAMISARQRAATPSRPG